MSSSGAESEQRLGQREVDEGTEPVSHRQGVATDTADQIVRLDAFA
jgi:hypothetical protein